MLPPWPIQHTTSEKIQYFETVPLMYEYMLPATIALNIHTLSNNVYLRLDIQYTESGI
jgi:hypothetical protein